MAHMGPVWYDIGWVLSVPSNVCGCAYLWHLCVNVTQPVLPCGVVGNVPYNADCKPRQKAPTLHREFFIVSPHKCLCTFCTLCTYCTVSGMPIGRAYILAFYTCAHWAQTKRTILKHIVLCSGMFVTMCCMQAACINIGINIFAINALGVYLSVRLRAHLLWGVSMQSLHHQHALCWQGCDHTDSLMLRVSLSEL